MKRNKSLSAKKKKRKKCHVDMALRLWLSRRSICLIRERDQSHKRTTQQGKSFKTAAPQAADKPI